MDEHTPKHRVVAETERKKSPAKWLIPLLLLLLLLGLLGWYALSQRDEQQKDSTATTSEQESTADSQRDSTRSGSEAIASTSALLAVKADSVKDGQEVTLTDGTVVEVLNDRAFTIGDASTSRFALLSPELDEGEAENTVQVQSGQVLQLTGKVVKVPADTMQLQADYELTEAHAQMLADHGFYVRVETIKMQ